MAWMPTLPKSPSAANGSSVEYHMVAESSHLWPPNPPLPSQTNLPPALFWSFPRYADAQTKTPWHPSPPLVPQTASISGDGLWLLDSLDPGPRRDLILIFFFLLSFTSFFLLDDGAQQVTRLVMFQSQRSVSAPPRRLIVTPTEIPTVAEPSPLSLDMGRNYGSQLGIQPPSESLQLEARLRAPSLGISAFHNMIRHKISSHLKTPSLSSGQLLGVLPGDLAHPRNHLLGGHALLCLVQFKSIEILRAVGSNSSPPPNHDGSGRDYPRRAHPVPWVIQGTPIPKWGKTKKQKKPACPYPTDNRAKSVINSALSKDLHLPLASCRHCQPTIGNPQLIGSKCP
ncbi:hypothetical protein CIHG_03190 [Coccidioides immitis H538.4]|uniref:Uncharacterized protein n=1 Tax=Coccidioides immitis H538.4 TaxID=396776 RepID=A0A0J8RN39_COCIT|nr:hypothetical protein CIHG_03190 [Coccidioides immitis H538.4]